MPRSRIRKKGEFTPPGTPPQVRESQRPVGGSDHGGAAAHRTGLDRRLLHRRSSIGFISTLGAWNVVIGFAFIFGG